MGLVRICEVCEGEPMDLEFSERISLKVCAEESLF